MQFIKYIILSFFILFLSSCHRVVRYEDIKITEIQKKSFLIAIDPGHGGKDSGAGSRDGQYHEKHFCLSTALLLQKHLEKMGYSTFITRDDDTFVPLKKRASVVNKTNANLFISVHYNAAKNKHARGLEIYYNDYPEPRGKAKKSYSLAEIVLNNALLTTREPSRGVKQAAFSVLVNTKMPSVLVEGGFLTNKQDLAQIKRASYWDKLALGIARGVDEYIIKEYHEEDSLY
jgi:N-acetylmuramoyl-L-alanine amidase